MSLSKRKKKRRQLGPRRKRMSRERRIRSATSMKWAEKCPGKDVIKVYAKWFGVDPLCAIHELRMLDVEIDDGREQRVRQSIDAKAKANAARGRAREKKEMKEMYEGMDDTFAYIAGYTSWGFPYGVTWEELGETPPWVEDE